jgi:hypothetical protein
METRGLVTRERADENTRGAVVVLTREGVRAEAAPSHFQGVRRHIIDLLTETQLKTLGVIPEIVVDHLIRFDSVSALRRLHGVFASLSLVLPSGQPDSNRQKANSVTLWRDSVRRRGHQDPLPQLPN